MFPLLGEGQGEGERKSECFRWGLRGLFGAFVLGFILYAVAILRLAKAEDTTPTDSNR
jgi:hypothetical protein